jgi:nucleotide-binding universal stress UspA family protein
MQIRTVLAAVSGGSASVGVVELACRLARRFGTHVEFLHVRLDPREIVVAAADGFGTPPAWDLVETAMQEAGETAKRTRRLFDDAIGRHGLLLRDEPLPIESDPGLRDQPSACWREEVGYSPQKISDRARLFDLMILGRSNRVVDEPDSGAIEEALLTSGRPVVIAPAEMPRVFGETIAVAWNDTPECARALFAAMPFLGQARKLHLLSLGPTQAAELARHLAWHGLRATVSDVFPVQGAGAGELLLAAARDHGADLLVMGGYGHAPWRETLFGGATREVIGTSLLPLFLVH